MLFKGLKVKSHQCEVEYMTSQHFPLYLVSKMRGNLIKIRSF